MESLESIRGAAAAMEDELVATRRALHRRPELGLAETETAALIAGRLEALGIEFERKGTAIVGLVRGALPGGTVALRADIDALPLSEAIESDFKSEFPGRMHACGHDAHTAILLGAARYFSERRSALPGNVKLLFQPAEETTGGAADMIRAGCLEHPRVDRVYGLHVMPYLPVGTVEVKRGALNGSSTDLNVVVEGKSGHGAYPEQGVDAVLIASHVVLALNELVSRYVSPLEQAVLTVGTISGGSAPNILAGEVRLGATLRTTSDAVRDALVARARVLAEGIAAGFGGRAVLEASYGYAALVNDDAEADRIARVAGALLGADKVRWKEKPSMGVEDFSYFVRERPGAFYHLGCGRGDGSGNAPLHSSRFDLDELCLAVGVAVQAAVVWDSLAELAAAPRAEGGAS